MSMDVDYGKKIKKEGYGQYNTTTCWLACYRMLYAWNDRDEMKIPGKLSGAGLDYKELCKRGVYIKEWPTAGSSLGMCGWEGKLVKEWSVDQLAHVLKTYGPLYFTWDYGSSGHAVLVVGYKSSTNTFKVYNPYNRFEPGLVDVDWHTGDQLRSKLHTARWALQAWY